VANGDESESIDLSISRRLDTIHIFGGWLSRLSTAQVLAHFDEYGPSHVEWISDTRCNVVFGDPLSAARALVGLSTPVHAELSAVESQIASLKMPLEQASLYVWRLGATTRTSSAVMLLRLATVRDLKKPITERAPSQYYERQRRQQQQQQRVRPQPTRRSSARRHPLDSRTDDDDNELPSGSAVRHTARHAARHGAAPYDREEVSTVPHDLLDADDIAKLAQPAANDPAVPLPTGSASAVVSVTIVATPVTQTLGLPTNNMQQ